MKKKHQLATDISCHWLQVAASRRSQWNQADMVCTSINLHKACQKAMQLGL